LRAEGRCRQELADGVRRMPLAGTP